MSMETEPTRTSFGVLPPWRSVLAVVAHPDDESFGLGAVLDAFTQAGTIATVLCLTRGEASTIHGVSGDLAQLREHELRDAAKSLGVATTVLRDHPDGALDTVDRARLTEDVASVARRHRAQGLLVFDPSGISAHRDHIAATIAALEAADTLELPVLGWTLPHEVAAQLNEEYGAAFVGHLGADIDLDLAVQRDRQRLASLAHVSQAIPTSVLWRRLELLGEHEYLRWLRRADRLPAGVHSGAVG